jgi:hypothetical protein
MNNHHSHIDDLFSKLHHYEADLAVEKAWIELRDQMVDHALKEKLESYDLHHIFPDLTPYSLSELHQKKQHKRFLWVWGVLFCFATLLIGYYLFLNDPHRSSASPDIVDSSLVLTHSNTAIHNHSSSLESPSSPISNMVTNKGKHSTFGSQVIKNNSYPPAIPPSNASYLHVAPLLHPPSSTSSKPEDHFKITSSDNDWFPINDSSDIRETPSITEVKAMESPTSTDTLSKKQNDSLSSPSPKPIRPSSLSLGGHWGVHSLVGLPSGFKPGLGIQAGIGVDMEKRGFYLKSGLDIMSTVFETQQIKVIKADSFPVLNPGGDTLGWFEQNKRDSTFTSGLKNQLRQIRIPFSFGATLYDKGRLKIMGAPGIEWVYLSYSTLHLNDQWGYYHQIPAAQHPRFILLLRMETQIQYRLNSRYSLYVNSQWSRSGDIQIPHHHLPSNHQLRLNVSNISCNFGLKYRI